MENDVKREVMEFLKLRGIYHWRNNTGRRGKVSYGFIGSADIIGILPDGRFLAIETKYQTKQSDKQREFQLNIEANNGLYILAHSVDDVKRGLPGKEKKPDNPQGDK